MVNKDPIHISISVQSILNRSNVLEASIPSIRLDNPTKCLVTGQIVARPFFFTRHLIGSANIETRRRRRLYVYTITFPLHITVSSVYVKTSESIGIDKTAAITFFLLLPRGCFLLPPVVAITPPCVVCLIGRRQKLDGCQLVFCPVVE